MDNQTQLNDLIKQVNDLKLKIAQIDTTLRKHTHAGVDGTKNQLGSLNLKPGSIMSIGDSAYLEQTVDINLATEREVQAIVAGADQGTFAGTSNNSQLNLEHQPATNGTSNQTFYDGYRPPLYSSTGSVTNAGSVLTDTSFQWATNSLAGAWINVYSDSATFYSYTIASNTNNTLTVNGTFSFTNTAATYFLYVPIYLGSATIPWRRLYTTTDIRFGTGLSASGDVCWIKHGTGSPEAVVTAQVGSLFLRRDGGAGTTLYVKQSGTGNTGWIAK